MRLKAMMMAAVALLAMAGVSPAFAQTCHVGGSAGYSIATTELAVGGLSIDGLGSRGTVAGVQIGCDVKLTGSQFVLGAMADYGWQDNKFAVNPGIFSASLGDSWSVGGRLGYQLPGTKVLPYVLAAYTSTKTDIPTLSSFHGVAYGGGIEVPLTGALTLSAETRWVRYASEDVGGLSIQPEQLTGMVRVNLHFDVGSRQAAPLK